jgi:carbonic anhydrase
VLNVKHGVDRIRKEFEDHPEIPSEMLDIIGAVYHLDTGEVDWIQ